VFLFFLTSLTHTKFLFFSSVFTLNKSQRRTVHVGKEILNMHCEIHMFIKRLNHEIFKPRRVQIVKEVRHRKYTNQIRSFNLNPIDFVCTFSKFFLSFQLISASIGIISIKIRYFEQNVSVEF
jgi:hypothetical protein